MSLPDGRRKGTCSLWLKRSEPCKNQAPCAPARPNTVDRTPRRQLGPALPHRSRARLGGAERSVVHRALRAPASRDHQLSSRRSSRRTHAGDKKTQYETHNTTTVVNITSYENVTVMENARARRGNLNAARRRRRDISTDGVPRRAPSQVTVYETVIELENVTTTQNVSVLVNETVKYNAMRLERPKNL